MAKGKYPNSAFVEKAIKDAFNDMAKQAKKLMLQPTETWQNHHPVVTVEVKEVGDDLFFEVSTSDKVYGYLDYGTAVRYATMTPDFMAKTEPGSWQAKQGAGGLAFVNKKVPRPGIEARNWSAMMSVDFGIALQDIINDILKTTTETAPIHVETGEFSAPQPPPPAPMNSAESSFLGNVTSAVGKLLKGLFKKF